MEKTITVNGITGIITDIYPQNFFTSTCRFFEKTERSIVTIAESYGSTVELMEQVVTAAMITVEEVETVKTFSNILPEEQNIINKFKDDIKFIIFAKKEGSVKHEISHVLYRFDNDYRTIVDGIWRWMQDLPEIEIQIASAFLGGECGYKEKDFADELVAHKIGGTTGYIFDMIVFPEDEITKCVNLVEAVAGPAVACVAL